jgi:DNA processing protein
VFAVPVSVYSPLSKGPHQLIKDGASLVASIADIQEELPVFGGFSMPASTRQTTDRGHDALLDAIDYIPTSVDQIIVRSGLTAAKVCSMLIGMEIAGKIRNCEGRYLRNLES